MEKTFACEIEIWNKVAEIPRGLYIDTLRYIKSFVLPEY